MKHLLRSVKAAYEDISARVDPWTKKKWKGQQSQKQHKENARFYTSKAYVNIDVLYALVLVVEYVLGMSLKFALFSFQ